MASDASSSSARCQKLDNYNSPLTVYPNPAVGIVHIKIADYAGTSIKVEAYNEFELRYYSLNAVYNAQDSAFDVDFSNTNPGYYRLIVTYGTSSVIHRIIRE